MVLKPCLLPLPLKWFKTMCPPGLMNDVWDASVVRVVLKVKVLTKTLHRVAFFLPPSPDVQYSVGRNHRREGLQRSVVIVREVHKAKDSLQALGKLLALCGKCSDAQGCKKMFACFVWSCKSCTSGFARPCATHVSQHSEHSCQEAACNYMSVSAYKSVSMYQLSRSYTANCIPCICLSHQLPLLL